MNDRGPVLQEWARRLGIGAARGSTSPASSPGLVPDSKWRDEGYKEYLRCAKKAKVEPGTTEALFECGGIERAWTAGDNVNLAVGQGDLQATPLQLAVAYSTIVNGGKVVRPHLGMRVEDGNGVSWRRSAPGAPRKIDRPDRRDAIMAGLHGAATARATARRATSSPTSQYRNVYGKTGTAERQPNPDQSWYACYVDHPTKPIVVVVTVEEGGFGAETAAPAARLILDEWFDLRDHEPPAGPRPGDLSTTRSSRLRAAAPARPARVAPAARPAAPAGHARAGGRLADRAQGRDAERHRGRAELLRPPPGGLRRASGWC